MTRDQFSSFVNAKINELKKDPKKLQSFFGNVEADEYGGLGVDLQTQHSAGFIPNFSSALNDAIAREQSSGLSKSQIYVDSHSSLKNKNNPMGLMVANRRDEPGGGIQGIRRAKKEGVDPKTYGGAMSGGFVPNFATGPIKPSKDYLDALKAAELFSSKLGKAAKSVDKFDKEISETDGSANQAPGKFSKTKGFLSENALSIGFGLQAAAGIAGEFAGGDDTQAGRATKAAAGGIGDIASFAGAGLQIAGPWGALVGGVIGAGKAVVDFQKAVNSKVPDMERALRNSSDSMNRFGESGQKLLTLNEQYGDALMSGNPTQAADIMIKTQKAYAEELSKLTQVQRESMISAIAQGKGQEEYAKILGEMQNSVKAQETATQLTKFSESGGLFSGPDKNLLAGLDKGLALDFTKDMDTASVVAALEKAASSLENPNLGTENQALDLMKSLASSESLSTDQRENLNKMIEAFATAAETTDLSGVAEGFLKSIKEKPKSDADAKRAVEARKAQIEAQAAKTKKEIEIREKTNSMLLKLQADTEAVYRRYNNSVEDFISSIETASQMMSAAGQFREEYLSQGGANKSITDPIKERNIVNKSNADLKVAIYKSQQEASVDFIKGTKDILSGLQTDSAKLGTGQSANDQANQLLKIKSNLEKALLPIQSMIQAGDYEGAKSETEKVFKNLKPEERSAIGEEKLTGAVEQLKDGIDKGARSQDLLVKNSQKDLAIQAQQLVFQKAMSKMTQAQIFGGTATSLLDPNGDQGGAFDTAIKALGNLKALGYNQAGLKQGKDQQVAGGGRDTWGLNGQKPSKGMASDLLKFYKSMYEFGGESVMSTESKDYGVIIQAVKDELRNRLDTIKNQGGGVVDQAVFSRQETTLAKLGGDDKVAELKALKETGFANISGETILREALKGYTGGALEGLDPSLQRAFKETSDEGAVATLLLLDDQKNQTKSILAGQTAQTDSLVAGLEAIVSTGYGTNEMLSQQPAQIAQAIGAILEKGRAEQTLSEEGIKANDLNKEYTDTSNKIQENSKLIKESEQQMQSAQSVLGKMPEGISTEEFIKQQESSINKDEVEKAKKLVGNYSRGQGLNAKDKTSALLAGLGNQALGASALTGEILTAGQYNFGSSYRFEKAEENYAAADGASPETLKAEYDKALKLIQKASAVDTLKGSYETFTSKTKANEGLSQTRQETIVKQNESAAKIKVAQEDVFKKTTEANIKKAQTMPTAGAAGKQYLDKNQAARQEAANKAALAENLGVPDGNLLNGQQKKNRARTSGAELTYNEFAGRRTSFESRALTQFGGANQKSYESLIKQGAVPSFEKFKNVYEELGGKGKGREFYDRTRAEMLGAQPVTKKPAAPVAQGAQSPAMAQTAESINNAQILQQFKNEEMNNLMEKYTKRGEDGKITFNPRNGFESQDQQDAFNKEVADLRKKQRGYTLENTPAAIAPTAKDVEDQTNKVKNLPKDQEQKKPEANNQQDANQLISNILQVVQKIATDFEQKAAGAQPGQVAAGAGAGGGNGPVSVSTPVNLTVNSQNGENKTEVVSVADKIKSDLTAFLSSKEFMDRVTTIAKNATGNPQPPTQIT